MYVDHASEMNQSQHMLFTLLYRDERIKMSEDVHWKFLCDTSTVRLLPPGLTRPHEFTLLHQALGLPRGASLTFETLEITIVPKIVCKTREYLFATLCIYYVNKSTTQRKNSKLIFLIEQCTYVS